MNYPEKIQAEITKRGGVVNYNEVIPEIRNNLLYYRDRAQQSVNIITKQLNLIIHVEIIEDFSFNAFATGESSFNFIGINRGTIATLSLVFSRIFADKNLFKFIGNTEVEESELPLLEDLSSNFEYTSDKLSFFNPPIDPIRRSTARHLINLALDFILAHEIGHIIRGHINFIQSKFHIKHDETRIVKNSDLHYRMSNKTLEMDADSWAVTMLLSSELNRVFGKLPIPGPEWKDIYQRPGIVLMQFGFAIATVFRIYGDQRLDQLNFENELYRKPRLRFVISMLEFSKHPDFLKLNETMKFDLTDKGIPINIYPTFDMIEEAFNVITGKEGSKVSISEAWGEIGIKQINTLIEFWNTELLKELENHAYLFLSKKNKI